MNAYQAFQKRLNPCRTCGGTGIQPAAPEAERTGTAVRQLEALLDERDRPDAAITEEHFVARVRAVVAAHR